MNVVTKIFNRGQGNHFWSGQGFKKPKIKREIWEQPFLTPVSFTEMLDCVSLENMIQCVLTLIYL